MRAAPDPADGVEAVFGLASEWTETRSRCVLSRMSFRPAQYAVAALLLVGGLAACGQAQTGTGATGGTGSASSPTAPSPTASSPTVPSPTASSPTASNTPPATVPATGRVTLTGVPHAGVASSCVLLSRYLLVGGTSSQLALLDAGTTAGTTVTVTGHTDPTQVSYCQQGTILVVDDVRAGS